MQVKLVKIQDNTSRQLTNIELLMNTVFGSGIPTKFIPGNSYNSGDKVYVENSDGSISIRECITPGIYFDTDNSGWKDFKVSADAIGQGTGDYGKFTEGEFEKGDIQVLTDDATGEVTIYECVVPGYYTQITEEGWDVIPFIPNNDETNQPLIDSIFNGTEVEEFVEGNTYGPDTIVYVVNESTGGINLYEQTGDTDTTNTPPMEPWSSINPDDYLDNDSDCNIVYATDQDILEMFGSSEMPDFPENGDGCGCGCDHDPNKPGTGTGGDEDEEPLVWEEF